MVVHAGATQPALRQVTDHVYWSLPDPRTDRPVMGAVSGERGTLVVDAGNSPAHAVLFLGELSRTGIAPPRFVALTHWHWDHVFGTQALDLPTFASLETGRTVAEMARLDWGDEALDRRVAEGVEIPFCRDMIKAEMPDRSSLTIRPPEIAFSAQVQLDLGGVTCHIVDVGGDHTAGSTIVYVLQDRFIFLGDCLGEDYYHGAPSYTTARLFPLLDRLLGYDAEHYLEGHAPEPLSRPQMTDYAALLRTIGREVERRGQDREALLSALQAMLATPLDSEHLEIVDAFLAGLSKSMPGG